MRPAWTAHRSCLKASRLPMRFDHAHERRINGKNLVEPRNVGLALLDFEMNAEIIGRLPPNLVLFHRFDRCFVSLLACLELMSYLSSLEKLPVTAWLCTP
jgi:hypothetical protein